MFVIRVCIFAFLFVWVVWFLAQAIIWQKPHGEWIKEIFITVNRTL
jgi:hypothetical protein